MSSSGGAMLSKEEENDAEVRREDQENINSFGRLNARLQEVQEEQAVLKVRICNYYDVDDITLVPWWGLVFEKKSVKIIIFCLFYVVHSCHLY